VDQLTRWQQAQAAAQGQLQTAQAAQTAYVAQQAAANQLLAPLLSAWPPGVQLGPLWNRIQTANLSRISVGQAPSAAGGIYLFCQVLNGDVALNVGGCRTELIASLPQYLQTEGQMRRYTWKTLFPSALYKPDSPWQVFTQWHHDGGTGTPPIQLEIHGSTARLRVMGDLPDEWVPWSAPLMLDHEYAFDLTLAASQDPAKGGIALSVDGQVICAMTAHRTMLDTHLTLKQGIYRHPAILSPMTVGHREMDVQFLA